MIFLLLIVPLMMLHPNLLPSLDLEPVTIRLIDSALVVMVFLLVCRTCLRDGKLRLPVELRQFFVPLLPFLAWMGTTLLIGSRDHLAERSVSYARLLITIVTGVSGGMFLISKRRLLAFHLVFVASALATILVALLVGPPDDVLYLEDQAVRYAGLLGVDSLGLISALLTVYAIVWPLKASGAELRLGIYVMGILGLWLSRSASSIGAAALINATLIASRTARWRPFILGLSILIAFLTVWWLRTSDFEGLLSLEAGSFAHRVALGYSGILQFAEHPLMGVGWQASAYETENLWWTLISTFAALPTSYFSAEPGRLSVHNFYIQMLAELGAIGFGLFVWAVYRIDHRWRKAMNSLRGDDDGVMWARWCRSALGVLLIWWNTNPLYGGQVESLAAVLLLASAAAALRLARRQSATLGVADRYEGS
jgi:O-antigen ligase